MRWAKKSVRRCMFISREVCVCVSVWVWWWSGSKVGNLGLDRHILFMRYDRSVCHAKTKVEDSACWAEKNDGIGTEK